MTNVIWHWKQFEQLSVHQLHELLKLRQGVFVIEQQCIYPDIDTIDKTAWHCLGYLGKGLCAYLRVYLDSDNVSIGRILTSAQYRGQGIGRLIVKESISFIENQYPQKNITISAQVHLEDFYNEFGFETTSQPFDEDGIMHIDMRKE